MEKAKYDIFISYRRIGGKNYARTLKPELEKRGFRVFLDFDELKDGVFDKRIMDAINEAPIFLVILSKGALDRCANEGDWVREEILYADKTNRHIVPVEIDKTFREFPENLPNEVKSVLGPHQFSQIDTETLLQESIDKMVRERIKPWVTKESTNTSSRKIESTDGAEIHIEVDADCDFYRFKKLVKALSPNEDIIVYLKPGKHKIEFISHEYSDIKESMLLDIPYENYSDLITVTLLPQIQNKKEEEAAKRKAEEEAKRKAEELRKEEEVKRKAEEEAHKKEEEFRLREEAKQKAKAEEARRKAEENKHKAERTYQKGKEYYDKNDYSHAYPLFLEAAEQGHAGAQNHLGAMYKNGQGINKDYAEAVKWYRKAAEQGVKFAQYNLGAMYKNGQGVNQDYAEAVKWYRKAAEQGYAYAQCNLGAMYKNGQGVNKDYAEAVKWYKKAVEQDNPWAQKLLGDCYFEGKGLTKDYEQAKALYEKAVAQGRESAKDNLQKILEEERKSHYVVKVSDKYGYADKNNNIVIPCKWTKVNEFVDGVGLVWDEKKMGAIDEQGNYYFPCKIECGEAYYLGHGLIKSKKGEGAYTIYDLNGKDVEYEVFTEMGDEFVNGYLYAVKYRLFGKNKYGKIDTKGKFIEDIDYYFRKGKTSIYED